MTRDEYDPLLEDMKARGLEEGLRAARAYSRWHLGSEWHADAIIAAFFDPPKSTRSLNAERSA